MRVIMYNRDICLRAMNTYCRNVTGKSVWMLGFIPENPWCTHKYAEAETVDEKESNSLH